MLIHYIKVAFRNLLKYKTQTILSIVGLAIGFACFALSVTWIHYEMSFDNFHKNGDRIYSVIEKQNGTLVKSYLSSSLAEYFSKTYPEVELSSMVDYGYLNFGEKVERGVVLETDSSFYQMFPELFEMNPFIQSASAGSVPMEITDTKAHELAAITKDPVGQIYEQRQVIGFMREIPINSRFHCDAISAVVPLTMNAEGNSATKYFSHTSLIRDLFLLLKEGTDIKAFEKKISNIEIEGEKRQFILVPLTSLRYRMPDPEAALKLSHVVIFAGVGALVILCALFNYLTLFVTRIRIRGREMALRKVNGSSNGQLVSLFSLEFILLLLISLFVGEVIVELCIPKFITLSGILLTRTAIYGETLSYAILLILISFSVGIIPISYFHYQTLLANIQPVAGPTKHLFRKVSLTFQLIISIGLIFATIVMFKQVYFMTNEGIGIDYKNIWNVDIPKTEEDDYAEKIAQIPFVTEMNKQKEGFFPFDGFSKYTTAAVNEKGVMERLSYNNMQVDGNFFRFYNIPFISGEPFKKGEESAAISKASILKLIEDERAVIINESMLKLEKDETSESIIGKRFIFGKVAGVVKNFYISSLTEEQVPIVFSVPHVRDYSTGALLDNYNTVYYKVMEGKAKEANEAIRTLLEKETGSKDIQFYSLEEHLEKVYRSERALLLLLGIITGVCILISIFGIYSMVSLTCQQRRKEIAIRKVFGATVVQILHSFFREYALLLGIAALIAFPVAYYLMRLWMEQYVRQTSIDGWIYLVILALVALIILVTIWSRVWKAASANPAEVVKSE